MPNGHRANQGGRGRGRQGFGGHKAPPSKVASGVAAVPAYVGQTFSRTPPGHRFNLYFKIWDKQSWEILKKNKATALKETLELGSSQELLKHYLERQSYLAQRAGCQHIAMQAISVSPFATGVGLEHPLENGFTFLNPYGLACLPGSGVKGVVRRAAEELALLEKDTGGWTILDVWWVFGFDATSSFLAPVQENRSAYWQDAYSETRENLAKRPDLQQFIHAVLPNGQQRSDYEQAPERFLYDLSRDKSLQGVVHFGGALSFWDVLPESKNKQLAIEIMTPHYDDYYQKRGTPADCGQPNPILFLVIPPESRFTFHVTANTHRMPSDLRNRWKTLLEGAFAHAFAWLGFGAKTAVGYGQFQTKASAETPEDARLENAARPKDRSSQIKKIMESVAPQFKTFRGAQDQSRIPGILAAFDSLELSLDERRAIAEQLLTPFANKKEWTRGWLGKALRDWQEKAAT